MQTIQLPDDIYQRLRRAAESEYREPAGQIAFLVDHYCKQEPQEKKKSKRAKQSSVPTGTMLHAVLSTAVAMHNSGVPAITAESLRKRINAGRTKTGRCRIETTLGNLTHGGFVTRNGNPGESTYSITDAGFAAIGARNEKPEQLHLHR